MILSFKSRTKSETWEGEIDETHKRKPTDELVALLARLSIAAIFWMSARTKVSGFLTIKESTFELFASEYKLPVIPPDMATYLATYAEHAFAILLVLGLFTRITAVGVLVMTAVIQVFVYPLAWPTHLTWAALTVYLITKGGGRVSMDRFFR